MFVMSYVRVQAVVSSCMIDGAFGWKVLNLTAVLSMAFQPVRPRSRLSPP